ncbi:DotH/IcmK family type IV secretion protein [Pseudomonas sp. NPDC096950]|uniref:DotH/IcmK family type IV secretion protein n=1 Tax=Pseudomonas sp. NPDC096950 TaxID=3364485 RepID=UPI00383A5940
MKLLVAKSLLLAVTLLPLLAGAEEAEQPSLEQRLDSIMVGSPKEVLGMRKKIITKSAAFTAPIVFDTEDEVPQDVLDIEDSFDITLAPDTPAPKVFISRYQSSAITFIDAYGNPWPIRKVSNFLGNMIEIDRALPEKSGKEGETKEDLLSDPQAGSFTVTALKHGVTGNITVYLQDLATPISILLVAKPAMYHRLATMKVEDAGPNTKSHDLFTDKGITLGTEADMDLNHALYGVTPSGSETMVVEGGEGQAWVKGDQLILRTPVAVFSPKIMKATPGNSGYMAYKLPVTTTVLGTNKEGRTVTLKILKHPATALDEQMTFK